ncbi:MAG: lipoate--protein ligase family protein [Myxococcota bacterium]|nr:lipoate--protein ligase family protein [Myxococcota bacterium]
MTRLTVHREGPGRSAVADTALSHALLRSVDAREAPESLRLYRPRDAMAFSLLDRTRPGFGRAVECARLAGFEPILRLAGGRAAVFERHALAFAWTVPARNPRAGIRARFEVLASLVARALCSLGVDARVGEVTGEYCPGEFSVNARGAVKLMGVGQRVLRSAAHVGGVVVVQGAPRIAAALEGVYAALGFPLDGSRTGAAGDEVPGIDADAVADALLAQIEQFRSVEIGAVPSSIRAQARRLEPLHTPAGSDLRPAP